MNERVMPEVGRICIFVLIPANMAATYQKITTLVTENQRFMLRYKKSQLWGKFAVNYCCSSCSSLLF